MNLPQSLDELLRWDGATGRDSFGTYTIITGYEGTGGCFWCGKPLEGRRRFCGNRSGHWTRYVEQFYWSYARHAALKRTDWTCENCGVKDRDVPRISRWATAGIEVHHIIPLEGNSRATTPFNVQWNLICLCHYCHLDIHEVMRYYCRKDFFTMAAANGQGVFQELAGIPDR